MGGAEVDSDCVAAWEDASALLASLGHEVEDVDLPFPAEAVPSFLALWFTMAAFTPIPPDQEPELLPLTQWLRAQGRAISAPDIFFHQAILQGSVRPAVTAMNAYDAILTPTVAMPPRPVGWFDEVEPAENFIRQTQFTPWTALFNLSGQPSVSVPLHWNADGPADRRHAVRPDGGRGHADLAVGAARVGPALAGQAPADLAGLAAGQPHHPQRVMTSDPDPGKSPVGAACQFGAGHDRPTGDWPWPGCWNDWVASRPGGGGSCSRSG